MKHELYNQDWTGQHLHTLVRVLSCRWPGQDQGGLCRQHNILIPPGKVPESREPLIAWVGKGKDVRWQS